MASFLEIFLWIIAIVLIWQLSTRLLSKFVRRRVQVMDPSIIGRILNSSFRKSLQPPRMVLERSGVMEGERVLDLGCGSGAFTIPLAEALGSKGLVLATDINGSLLKQLLDGISSRSTLLSQVEVVQASAHDLPFRDSSVDRCIMVSSLQEIPDRSRALREVMRVLRDGGILAVTEFFIDPDFPLISTTVKLVEGAGFQVEAKDGSPWSYTVRFVKTSSRFPSKNSGGN